MKPFVLVLATVGLLSAPAGAEAPTQVASAVTRLQQEIAYSQHAAKGLGLRLPPEQVSAVAAMSLVQGRVSAPVYGFRKLAGLPLPGGATGAHVAERSLALGAGLCGNAAWTFVTLLRALNVEARVLSISYAGGGHVAAEVQWAGRWHFFDPTWGTFYARGGSILSLGEIVNLRRPGSFAVTNQTLLWRQIARTPTAARETGRAFLSQQRLVVKADDGQVLYRRG